VKCDGYRILIQEMLQGRLNLEEAAVVAGHMDACEACRSYHRDLVAASPAADTHGSAVADPAEPLARAQVWPTAVAAALVMFLLGGLVFLAMQRGWVPALTPHRSGHGCLAQERSR